MGGAHDRRQPHAAQRRTIASVKRPYMYVGRADEIRARLEPYSRYLRLLASDATVTLYEIVSFP